MSDLGLFPKGKPDGARYAARPKPRPWTAQADAVLFPLVASCHTQEHYTRACLLACEVLKREPTYAATARPTADERAADSISIIERRTVTQTLTRGGLAVVIARSVFQGSRTGLPLSWGEQKRILLPYSKKNDDERMDLVDLLYLLDRGPADIMRVAVTLDQLRADPEVAWTDGKLHFSDSLFALMDYAVTCAPEARHEAWRRYLGHFKFK